MNKVVLYSLTCAVLFGVTDADAAYVIKLRNGNEFVTTRYWHEGAQVFFDTYGGVFGVDKAFVNTIEKTDQVVRLVTVSDRDPSEKLQTDSTQEIKDASQEKGNQEPTVKKDREVDDPIVAEFNRLKDKAKEVDGMLASEIRELLSQITAFKNKLAKDSKLFVQYGREFNDLQELGSTVETALRSRTQ
jgi:hypothetical protein